MTRVNIGQLFGDPNRQSRVRVLRWRKEGFPDFD